MTGDGRLHNDTDQTYGAAQGWLGRTGDLSDAGPAPHPGNAGVYSTSAATLLLHGNMELTTAQLTTMLEAFAGKTQAGTAALAGQDKDAVSMFKDLVSMLTSVGQGAVQIPQQMITGAAQVASSGTQTVTTAVKSVTDAMPKTGSAATAGSPLPGAASSLDPSHAGIGGGPTTTTEGNRDAHTTNDRDTARI